MTTALLDKLQLDDITRQAREVHPARTLLTWIAALLFAIGWVTCKTFSVLWFVGVWSFVAIREGWRSAKVNSHGPGRPG